MGMTPEEMEAARKRIEKMTIVDKRQKDTSENNDSSGGRERIRRPDDEHETSSDRFWQKEHSEREHKSSMSERLKHSQEEYVRRLKEEWERDLRNDRERSYGRGR